MYVLVHHDVFDRAQFWSTAEAAIPKIPMHLRLHHTLAARNGNMATCLWEADSVAAVQEFLEPALGSFSRNRYEQAENRDGIALPTDMPLARERPIAAT